MVTRHVSWSWLFDQIRRTVKKPLEKEIYRMHVAFSASTSPKQILTPKIVAVRPKSHSRRIKVMARISFGNRALATLVDEPDKSCQ